MQQLLMISQSSTNTGCHVTCILLPASKEIVEFRYITRIVKQTTLFAIFCENDQQGQKLEQQYGIPMFDEYRYILSKRTDWILKCEGRIDPKWHNQRD